MMPKYIVFLLKAAQSAASADNSQPWHFSWDGSGVNITYDLARVDGKTFSMYSPATLLAIGNVIENIDQAAKLIGVSIRWLPKLVENRSAYYRFETPVNDVPLPQDVYNHPLFKRHTNRFPYEKTALADVLLVDEIVCDNESVKINVIEDKPEVRDIADLIVECSEIRFQTREIHQWLSNSFRFTKDEVENGDGLDVDTIDLPPGGSFFLRLISDWRRMSALNKLGIYKLLSKIDGKAIVTAPALIAIKSGPGRQDIVDAGRLMCRTWIILNSKGIAVQPYYVIPDQLNRHLEGKVPPNLVHLMDSIEKRCNAIFRIKNDERLQMVLRIGYAKRQVPKAKRLPLEVISTDIAGKP